MGEKVEKDVRLQTEIPTTRAVGRVGKVVLEHHLGTGSKQLLLGESGREKTRTSRAVLAAWLTSHPVVSEEVARDSTRDAMSTKKRKAGIRIEASALCRV